jgi:hypothetical protein
MYIIIYQRFLLTFVVLQTSSLKGKKVQFWMWVIHGTKG